MISKNTIKRLNSLSQKKYRNKERLFLVEGDKVQLVGFGTFETRERAARQGRNPRNPEEVIEIPASKAPVFKAGKGLKDIING